MAGFTGAPPIVTDGLVFAVDAANYESYPGSGTVWKDLSGNGNDGTLTNGPTFDSANGGSIAFDGTNDYCSIQETSTLQTSASGEFTAASCFKYDTAATTYPQIFWNRRTVIGINSLDNSKIYTFIGGGFLNSTTLAVAGSIYYVAVTFNNGALKIYVNGNLQNSGTVTLESQIGYTPNIGASITADYYNGNIFTVHQYNKELSASEITQNYNALKGRFGL